MILFIYNNFVILSFDGAIETTGISFNALENNFSLLNASCVIHSLKNGINHGYLFQDRL